MLTCSMLYSDGRSLWCTEPLSLMDMLPFLRLVCFDWHLSSCILCFVSLKQSDTIWIHQMAALSTFQRQTDRREFSILGNSCINEQLQRAGMRWGGAAQNYFTTVNPKKGGTHCFRGSPDVNIYS